MCVIRVLAVPPKAMRKSPLCANGPQRKVCQSEIRESNVSKDGECRLSCSSRAVWMAILSYSLSHTLLIHKAAWARTARTAVSLQQPSPPLRLFAGPWLSQLQRPFFFPFPLLKSLTPSFPFVSLLPLSTCPSLQIYCVIIKDKCFRLLEVLIFHAFNKTTRIKFCFDALLTPSLWVFTNDPWAHMEQGPVEATHAEWWTFWIRGFVTKRVLQYSFTKSMSGISISFHTTSAFLSLSLANGGTLDAA